MCLSYANSVTDLNRKTRWNTSMKKKKKTAEKHLNEKHLNEINAEYTRVISLADRKKKRGKKKKTPTTHTLHKSDIVFLSSFYKKTFSITGRYF